MWIVIHVDGNVNCYDHDEVMIDTCMKVSHELCYSTCNTNRRTTDSVFLNMKRYEHVTHD